jgi:hypothetical protein
VEGEGRMIDKVVEVVLNKFLQPRSRKEKADDDVKDQLVFLHEALVNCHNTYKQYASKRTEINLQNWREAVRDLAQALDDVGLALSSFAPEAFDYASQYLMTEAPFEPSTGDAEELERTVIRLQLLESGKPRAEDDDEFKEATVRLREFMKTNMTVGQIQQAQENFRRNTYRKFL